MEQKQHPFSLGNIIFLKEKGGMKESFPRQIEERGVWSSQGKGKDKGFSFFSFFPLHSLVLLT